MAALLQTPDHIQSTMHVFMPQDTCDHPYDITLVVEDGKEIRAHQRILAHASPFFEKLLGSDMKEANEGVVRLEMLSEPMLGDILEFIYTGCVQISTEDRAEDLIAMADYFLLPQLKSLAGRVLVQKLNYSNCVSIYHFAESYQCEELISATKTFIFANFGTVAKTEEFLSMSSKEVEMWISSDEINVSSEEDVFEFILAWIERGKTERKKYFADLFRHVRFFHVSRDYLHSKIEINELVKTNALSIDSRFLNPRKSLEKESPVIVVFEKGGGKQNLCYFPREDTWYKAPDEIPSLQYRAFSCHDKLYLISKGYSKGDGKILRYDSFSDCSITDLSLPEYCSLYHTVFAGPEDQIYDLVANKALLCQRDRSGINKYNSESNGWEHVSTFEPFSGRRGICTVAKDNFIYFLGGRVGCSCEWESLTDADRYDLGSNKWEKLPELKEERSDAHGAAVHGRIFVIGGMETHMHPNPGPVIFKRSCEVYSETTNEWQLIVSLKIPRGFCQGRVAGAMFVDDKLYALSEYSADCICQPNTVQANAACMEHTSIQIEYYDPEKNEWNTKTKVPTGTILSVGQACSMMISKGSKFLEKVSSPLKCPNPSQSGSVEPS